MSSSDGDDDLTVILVDAHLLGNCPKLLNHEFGARMASCLGQHWPSQFPVVRETGMPPISADPFSRSHFKPIFLRA